MSGKGLAKLRQLLVERYDTLRSLVAYRLGTSGELAGDALHDAYVRLAGRDDLDSVRHPQTYLVNTAVHVAIDRIRADSRLVSQDEIDELFDLGDAAADPGRGLAGRRRMEQMMQVLAELPARQSELLIEARVHGTPRRELALRWGISEVLVGREIKAAHRYCVKAMKALGHGDEGWLAEEGE